MGQKDSADRTTIVPRIIAVILVLLFYVLSYAPMVRFVRGPYHSPPPRVLFSISPNAFEPQNWETAYAPVMWLLDETPLNKPLLAWAELWNVDRYMYLSSFIRFVEDWSSDPVPPQELEIKLTHSVSGQIRLWNNNRLCLRIRMLHRSLSMPNDVEIQVRV